MEPNARFQISETDAIEAARFAMRRRLAKPPVIWLLALIGICVVLLIVLDLIQGGLDKPVTIVALAALPVLFLVLPSLARYQARRHYRQSKALGDEVILNWHRAGLEMESPRGNFRLDWCDFHDSAESANLILLYQSELLYNLVPKRALSKEQLDDIRELVAEARMKKR